ncbi:MAG TPA: SDR family oxidoreductase [Alphaproteobacteria bacterium]|nr:SDR family oxidoreductase [Alphaproteobacteria bacterium]
MPTVFISGANRGLGLEFAKQYAADGWQVIGTCRDPARADALRAIPETRRLPLDVTEPQSIAACAEALAGEKIDLLLNNAGIYGSIVGDKEQTLERMDIENWLQILKTDLIAPFALTRALLPNLGQGSIVGFLSSELGSIARNRMGEIYGYRSSKAALNMVGRSLSIDLKAWGIIVVLLHPGWAHTDMGGPRAPVDPVESIAGLRRVLARVTPESSGRFLAWDGREMPW